MTWNLSDPQESLIQSLDALPEDERIARVDAMFGVPVELKGRERKVAMYRALHGTAASPSQAYEWFAATPYMAALVDHDLVDENLKDRETGRSVATHCRELARLRLTKDEFIVIYRQMRTWTVRDVKVWVRARNLNDNPVIAPAESLLNALCRAWDSYGPLLDSEEAIDVLYKFSTIIEIHVQSLDDSHTEGGESE